MVYLQVKANRWVSPSLQQGFRRGPIKTWCNCKFSLPLRRLPQPYLECDFQRVYFSCPWNRYLIYGCMSPRLVPKLWSFFSRLLYHNRDRCWSRLAGNSFFGTTLVYLTLHHQYLIQNLLPGGYWCNITVLHEINAAPRDWLLLNGYLGG